MIDAYRPVAGEVTLAVMGFKCRWPGSAEAPWRADKSSQALFGFLFAFETNPWIDQSGYQNAYGAMAGISAGVLILWWPLYVWGKRVRHSTWKWPVVYFVRWGHDREVGE